MIPARFFGYGELPPELAVVPAWATIFTSMFLHGGWLHLGGNMLYLWIFGDNIEDSMGHVRYLVFYLLCGAAAALTQGFVDPDVRDPDGRRERRHLRRARRLHPPASRRDRARAHLPRLLRHRRARAGADRARRLVRAAALQRLAMAPPGAAGVAFWAHIGGFVAGLVLVSLFKRRKVHLLEKPHSRAFHMERRRGPWG